jgi:hypothetical protein
MKLRCWIDYVLDLPKTLETGWYCYRTVGQVQYRIGTRAVTREEYEAAVARASDGL